MVVEGGDVGLEMVRADGMVESLLAFQVIKLALMSYIKINELSVST